MRRTHPGSTCRSGLRRLLLATLATLVAGLVTSVPAGAGSAATAVAASGLTATGRHSLPAVLATTNWWVPSLGSQPWQWEISHPLHLSRPQDMGTEDKLPDGRPAPAPVIYDIDGIINPASTVATLHALGKHVVCYVEVGAAGNYYSAGAEGVATTYYDQLRAAGVFGSKVGGYPEYYLDIRSPATVAVIESMIRQQCGSKGFDAVETDIDEEYGSHSGFPLTQADEEFYMATVAQYLHGLGLGWWIKNPDDTGDGYAAAMEPLADAVLTEQCNQYGSCDLLSAYRGHKAVFNAEYKTRTKVFCPSDNAVGFNGAKFNVGLTGLRRPCA